MSIKESINKTELLKNNTKSAKNNINSKLSGFGVGTVATLAEVPSKLNSLAGTLHKFAEGDINIYTGPNKQFKLTLPIDFDVKCLILTITNNNRDIAKFPFEFHGSQRTARLLAYRNLDDVSLTFDKVGIGNFNASAYTINGSGTFTIKHWVAIG